jgi:glycosyltransferase involved in cell wall biosynthesis
MTTRVLFFRPSMAEGGADRVTATVLRLLDRTRFAPSLALMRMEGPFLAELPHDVAVHQVRAPRLALAAPSLAWLLRELQPDVLFSTSSTGNIVAAAAHLAARSSARLVLSERTPLFRAGVRDARHRAFALAELGLPPERVRVIDNPMIDAAMAAQAAEPVGHRFFEGAVARRGEAADRARAGGARHNDDAASSAATAHDHGAASRAPVIVACGRMVPLKDYPTLLRAFAAVRKARPARLVILGDGPERPALEELTRTLGISDEVWFVGFDKNPFRYFARAAVLLHASRAEGMPGAQIQAMATGLPVVATDCEFGPREVIRDGETGFLCPVGDVSVLAARVLTLLHDEAKRARMGAAARRSVARFEAGAAMRSYEAALAGDVAET